MSNVKFIWSDAAIARLRELLEVEGVTGSQAVIILSREFETSAISRGSVLGKAFRLGVKLKTGQRCATEAGDKIEPKRKQRVPVPKTAKPAPAHSGGSVGLLKLLPWHCRFPVKDAPTRFCGEVAATGKPYCADHCRAAYRPVATPVKSISVEA